MVGQSDAVLMFYTSRKRTAELAPTILRPKFPAKLLSNFPGSFRELSIFSRTFLFARKISGVACWGVAMVERKPSTRGESLIFVMPNDCSTSPMFVGGNLLSISVGPSVQL